MRHNYLYFLTFFMAAILLIACKSDPKTNDRENDKDTTSVADTTSHEDISEDTAIQEEDTAEVEYEDPATQEAHEEIVKKYGTQWDFCTCVQKSDSVNTALMEANDEEFDAVMERSDYIDNKCKGLLIQPNATPEDRAKHEIKVKNCLQGK